MKIQSTLPKGSNGLTAIASRMIRQPNELHVVIAIMGCKSYNTEVDTDEVEPTARILRVEVLPDADKPAALAMFKAAVAKRTGGTILAGTEGWDEELSAAFNLTTGEVSA